MLKSVDAMASSLKDREDRLSQESRQNREIRWLRGLGLNLRPPDFEPDELPSLSPCAYF
jgi:hypothetical protein